MPTEKPRVTFTVSHETLQKIDDYRFANKSKNQTQAILALIEKGLSGLEATKKPHPLPDEAIKLAQDYNNLDPHGQKVVRMVADEETARMAAELEKTTQPAHDSQTEIIELPFPIQSAAAGTGDPADDETTNYISVLRNAYTSKADYVLRVNGHSMEPQIYDDDLILVRSQPAVKLGETGIFITEGGRVVKVYREDRLESVNPEHPDLAPDENIRCVGKVIGILEPEWIVE